MDLSSGPSFRIFCSQLFLFKLQSKYCCCLVVKCVFPINCVNSLNKHIIKFTNNQRNYDDSLVYQVLLLL